MKVLLSDYVHGANGMSLELRPETEVEKELLRAFWHHADLFQGNGKSGVGFYISWNPDKDRVRGGMAVGNHMNNSHQEV